MKNTITSLIALLIISTSSAQAEEHYSKDGFLLSDYYVLKDRYKSSITVEDSAIQREYRNDRFLVVPPSVSKENQKQGKHYSKDGFLLDSFYVLTDEERYRNSVTDW